MGNLSHKEQVQLLDEYDKRMSETSLYHFSKHVLGYDLEPHVHMDLCSVMDDQSKRLNLILMPRGSFKTTVGTQSYVTQRLIQNPNLRFLLDSEVLQNALDNLGVIKRIFEHHPRVRAIWGDYTSKLWTQDSITVGKRTNYTLAQPSISTSSIETIQVGPHYDEIIVDDIHSEKNSKTKDQIEVVINHLRRLWSLLEPGGRLTFIGTRWAEGDAYNWLMETLKDQLDVITRSAYNPDGSLFFPERLNDKFLLAQKNILGLDLFNSQYRNDPIPSEENARFKKSQFKYFTTQPEGMDIYVTADPALPGGERSDYFAIVAAGLTRDNDVYVMSTDYGHWETHDAVCKVLDIAEKHSGNGLRKLGIETNLFQKLIKFDMQAEMRKRGKFYNIVEIKHYKESKEERILAMQPRYQCGAVYHHESLKGGELEEELVKFPKAKKKDVADALASVFEIANIRMKLQEKAKQFIPKNLNDYFMHLVELKRKRMYSRQSRFVNNIGGIR